jgi:antitoxin component YwqK of YwqJK toxin-antitoxin module
MKFIIDKNGLRQGYWEHGSVYNKKHYLISKGNYLDGKHHGYWERYHYNGNVWYRGNYNNDKCVGYWEYYYVEGGLGLKSYFI